jgi:outer membrane biosynthesis protein TonB
LEKVLAESLARCTGADIPGIIQAAQECCKGGGETVATAPVTIVETPAPKPEKAKAVKATVEKPVEQVKPVEPLVVEPTAEKPQATPAPTVGIDLSGLFVGTGADKKVVKTVFLAAVEQAKTLAHLVALNATCDCGFATGDYTEETAAVLKRKLARWGAAQE